MNDISIKSLNPITEEEAAAMVSPQTKEDLAAHITMAAPEAARAARSPWRRRLLVSLPVAVAATAAVVVLSSGGGGVGTQPAEASALSFQREGGYLVVKIEDPVADPARYRKEFAERGLNIDLRLQATAPGKAGKLLFLEDQYDPAGEIKTVEGKCGATTCTVAVKVPVNYTKYASIVFGRAAGPGEMFETGDGDEPGAGIGIPGIQGRRVSDVVAVLAKRKAKIEYRYVSPADDRRPPPNSIVRGREVRPKGPYPDGVVPADKVQPDWYVHDGLPGSTGQIILFVGPEHP